MQPDWDAERDGFLNTAAWRKLRAAFVRAKPVCEACKAVQLAQPTEHVDHSIARGKHGGAPLAWENLMGLCISHHSTKTRLELSGPLCEAVGEWGERRPVDRNLIIEKLVK